MPPSRRTLLRAVAATVPLALAGCQGDQSSTTNATGTTTTEATATTTETGATATATETRSATATSAPTTEASVDIETETDDVSLGEDGEVMVRFEFAATGGSVAETSWDTIDQPDGSGVGFLDYGDYLELKLSDPGEYVLQLTATFEDGTIARDTFAFTVVEGTTTS